MHSSKIAKALRVKPSYIESIIKVRCGWVVIYDDPETMKSGGCQRLAHVVPDLRSVRVKTSIITNNA